MHPSHHFHFYRHYYCRCRYHHLFSLLLCILSSYSRSAQSLSSPTIFFIAGRRHHGHDRDGASSTASGGDAMTAAESSVPGRRRFQNQQQHYPFTCDTVSSSRLGAFANKRGWHWQQQPNDDDSDGLFDEDDDYGDNEPPSISTSPQEFRYRLQQRQLQDGNSIINNNNNNNNISSSGPEQSSSTTAAAAAADADADADADAASAPRSIMPSSLPENTRFNNIHKYNNKSKNTSIQNNIFRNNKRDLSAAAAASSKPIYICTNCQSEYVQWVGKCSGCNEYNTIAQEYRSTRVPSSRSGGSISSITRGRRSTAERSVSSLSWLDGIAADPGLGGSSGGGCWGSGGTGPVRVTDIYQDMLLLEEQSSSSSWMEAYSNGSLKERRTIIPDDPELNAVLGGGLMPGSITLVGGDPGVGKSTLLLQMAGSVASLAERSLQYQGIGMGPPLPSPAMPASTATRTDSETNEINIDSNDNTVQKASQSSIGGVSCGGIGPVIYISGEENANQIASRALRLGIQDPELLLWCETDADSIANAVVNSMLYHGAAAAALGDPSSSSSFYLNDEEMLHRSSSSSLPLSRPPSLIVIDSIQTMVCDAAGASSVGGITQVRECVGLFLRLAKSTGVPIMLVGHVTKSGDVAGPRTVEHMVDCVLYLEGGALLGAGGGSGGSERGGDGGGGISSLRVLRAAKNRFGSSEEVGVYEMGRAGRLIPISDPSSFFLSTRLDNADAEGCAISVVLEGIRSMTVEVQALVAWSAGSAGYSGRRIVDGISNSRLLLILAVLHKRYGISFRGRDVYVNVVGGMHLGRGSKSGGGSDLAVAVSIVSSLVGIPVRSDTAFVGEIGLLGELRPVHSLDKRISEARRMGFSRIVTPASSNQRKNRGGKVHLGPKEASAGGIKQLLCDNLMDAINCGLVSKLPSKQSKSGAMLNRTQRFITDGRKRAIGVNDALDVIEDDEDDDYDFE